MKEFLKFVAEIFNVSKNDLNESTEYGSISQWDSLMHIRLVAEIEDKYGSIIPFEEIGDIKTLKDFYRYVEIKK